MKHIYSALLLGALVFIIFSCACEGGTGNTTNTTNSVGNDDITTPTTPAPPVATRPVQKQPAITPLPKNPAKTNDPNYNPHTDNTIGKIKNACDLLSKEVLTKYVPGFDSPELINLIPRNSPDNHSSACECRIGGREAAFVLGYRKNPRNLQFIDEIIMDGETREYLENIPPYRPLKGLGLKAAWSKESGYLKWVEKHGILLYARIYPQTPNDLNILLPWSQEITANFETLAEQF